MEGVGTWQHGGAPTSACEQCTGAQLHSSSSSSSSNGCRRRHVRHSQSAGVHWPSFDAEYLNTYIHYLELWRRKMSSLLLLLLPWHSGCYCNRQAHIANPQGTEVATKRAAKDGERPGERHRPPWPTPMPTPAALSPFTSQRDQQRLSPASARPHQPTIVHPRLPGPSIDRLKSGAFQIQLHYTTI